jgi:cell wall-associated NlpC family hydrolase
MAKVNGIAVAEIIAGTALFWSGFKGQSIAFTLKDLLQGKIPQSSHEAAPTIGVAGPPSGSTGLTVGGGSPAGSTTDSAIANDALKYEGHPYLYSGAPGLNGQNPWDCSSFVNWVLGHDLHLDIPGYKAGTYNGSVHGPSTFSYLVWGGAKRIPRSQVAAGDILVWNAPGIAHMGIAISNAELISAEDPANGTKVDNIDGFFGPAPPFCFRLVAASA